MSGNNNNSADDADVWDDTALIRGWDDAVAEYQRYHSIYHHEGGPAPTPTTTTTITATTSEGNPNAISSTPQNLAHNSMSAKTVLPEQPGSTATQPPPPQPLPLPQPPQQEGIPSASTPSTTTTDARSASATE